MIGKLRNSQNEKLGCERSENLKAKKRKKTGEDKRVTETKMKSNGQAETITRENRFLQQFFQILQASLPNSVAHCGKFSTYSN